MPVLLPSNFNPPSASVHKEPPYQWGAQTTIETRKWPQGDAVISNAPTPKQDAEVFMKAFRILFSHTWPFCTPVILNFRCWKPKYTKCMASKKAWFLAKFDGSLIHLFIHSCKYIHVCIRVQAGTHTHTHKHSLTHSLWPITLET